MSSFKSFVQPKYVSSSPTSPTVRMLKLIASYLQKQTPICKAADVIIINEVIFK